MTLPRRHPLLFPVLAAVMIVAWSSGFIGFQFTAKVASPAQVLFWRNAVSGIGLLPLIFLRGPRLTVRAVAEQGLYAFLGLFLYVGGFSLGMALGVPTGLVALMTDLVPLGIAVLSAPMLGRPLSPRQWIGTAVSVAGVVMVTADTMALGAAPLWAYGLPILGMMTFALATVLQERRRAVDLAIPQRLGLQCLWAAAMFAPFAHVSGGVIPPASTDFALGITWLVLLATWSAWAIYYLCLRLCDPARVAAIIYLSPPLTMIWAWAMFGEPLSLAMGIGLVVTLGGVALVAYVPKVARA